jgi:hypothetical protein
MAMPLPPAHAGCSMAAATRSWQQQPDGRLHGERALRGPCDAALAARYTHARQPGDPEYGAGHRIHTGRPGGGCSCSPPSCTATVWHILQHLIMPQPAEPQSGTTNRVMPAAALQLGVEAGTVWPSKRGLMHEKGSSAPADYQVRRRGWEGHSPHNRAL